jgi:AcrR family transcriptional regulator
LNTVKIARRKPKRAAYHHGDLRQQLLKVAEEIILERGVDGFTLREAARRVGVSPAAPAHHFKDAKGLLTEVALLGFREFGDVLDAADQGAGSDPAHRLRSQAVAYVEFALRQPARFQLMFRQDKLDYSNADLGSAATRAYQVLERAIRSATRTPAGQELPLRSHGLLLAVWSLVHGYSHLALGGEIRAANRAVVSKETLLNALLPAMLEYLPVT